MAKVYWAKTDKSCKWPKKHKAVVLNPRLGTNQGFFKVYRCAICGTTGRERLS
jgi:hypothetical protein